MKARRLPRKTYLGLNYVVEVVLASQTLIRDVMELEDDDSSRFDGCWVCHLGDNELRGKYTLAGMIYVDQSLTSQARRVTYWHELDHAVNDIRDFDK